MKRTIAVVTSSRADYSHLYWPLKTLSAHPDVDLKLIVLAAHLSPAFGCTVRDIERDGFSISSRIECLVSSDTDVGMAKTLGLAMLGLSDVLSQMRPDLLLVIADRYEMLAPVNVALALRIPIAHIEGGEISEGAIDDAVRNAITKMAHIHFTSTHEARRRVIALGEEPWRVHRAGAPSLDHLVQSKLLTRKELEQELEITLNHPTIVVAYHPVTLLRDTTEEAEALFAALAHIEGLLLFCYPNADAGRHKLLDRTRSFLDTRANSRIFVNLNTVTYWSLLREADLLIGNSSSGIMEAASWGLPVVNIGLRQYGRERAANVLDAEPAAESIQQKVSMAQDPAFRKSLEGMTNPYGEGFASQRIVDVLTTVPLHSLLRKRAVSYDEAKQPS
jgi:UDP-hydrolysing UDP-N-acetyl-D-glucosamine 2-epimerase